MAAATDMHIFYNDHSAGFECLLEKYCKRRKGLVLVATIVDNHVKPTLSVFYPAFECRHIGLVTSDSILNIGLARITILKGMGDKRHYRNAIFSVNALPLFSIVH